VGAGQRLGRNLEKLSDTAECFAVEGTVTGELGRQHYACGVVVGIIGGRVPPGSRGGPVSAEVRKAAAEAPIEMFVLAHDSGKQAGPGGVSEHFVGRCLEKIAKKMLAVPVADGQLRSPPVNAEVVIVPRVEGRAQVHTLDFVKAQARAASDSGAASHVDHASAQREYSVFSMTQPSKRCLPSSREAALWTWVGEWGGGYLSEVICHECASLRGRDGCAQVHTLDFGKAQARAATGEWGEGALWG
jgi:hypothetical protein